MSVCETHNEVRIKRLDGRGTRCRSCDRDYMRRRVQEGSFKEIRDG